MVISWWKDGDFMGDPGKPTKKLEEHGGTCMKMVEKNVILATNGGKI